jgi:nucleotide-binding universal stress UspA family protein
MKIMIATDGSEHSMAAVEECCRMIIRPDTAEVLIVSAYENAYPMAAEPFAISAEYYQQLDNAVREQASGFIEGAKNKIAEAFPSEKIAISTEILRGSPAQQIVERAKEWGADVIVAGSHGRGFWGRLLGSVSNSVVHHAPCSVLIVRKPVD